MERIIVKTQEEWDAISADFGGVVEIRNGQNWIYIKERKGRRVEAWGNSSVVARGNSSVVARENSSVVARENSSVVARGNSSVEAWGNSSVEAWENSSVVAWGNVQICQYSDYAKLKTFANARIVFLPRNLDEFIDFHGVKRDGDNLIMYKAVHGEDFHSDYKSSYNYEIGKTFNEACDPDERKDCSWGLHIATLIWALCYGDGWSDLKIIECSVPIDEIVYPVNNNGKLRTSELTVLREVPLEECGLYGKALAKKRART